MILVYLNKCFKIYQRENVYDSSEENLDLELLL